MRKVIICIVSVLLLSAVGVLAQKGMRQPIGINGVLSEEPYRTKWALLIGINKYPNLPVDKQLHYADNDVKELKNVLLEQYQFHESNIMTLVNEQATYQGIKDKLTQLSSKVKVNSSDCVLIYFSGHGQTVPLPRGGDMGFLLPYDAKVDMDDVDDISSYYGTCIGMDILKNLSLMIPAKHIIFLVDACYSGLAITGKGELNTKIPNYLKRVASISAQQIITAGMNGDVSSESYEWGHGAFTYKLLEALRTGIADNNDDGVTTALELAAHLQNVVPNISPNQTPQYGIFSGEGNFLFIMDSQPTSINKMKEIDSAMASVNNDMDKYSAEFQRTAQEASNKAVAEANANAIAEDEKVKMMAKEAADNAMNKTMEADKRAQQESNKKEQEKATESTIYTIYFDSGETNIKSDSINELEKAAAMIEKSSDAVVNIEGHTDNTPIINTELHSNWTLSQSRANTVMKYLVEKLGITEDKVSHIVGFAYFKPTAPNDELNRWKNNRVEIIVNIPIKLFTKEITGKDGAPMVLIHAGEFQMGSNDCDAEMVLLPVGELQIGFQIGSNDGNNDEKPVHTVYIDAFYMDVYEVTNAQYKKFVQATGHIEPSGYGYVNNSWQAGFKPWQDKYYNDDNLPVVCVSFEDAKAYANWASERLPTEAEWEKAARGGLVGKKYPLGDTIGDVCINDDGFAAAYPVGKFSPNGYGVYDIVGNAYEWCADWYSANYYAYSPKQNPTGPDSGNMRIIRGGGWYLCFDKYLRVANRDSNDPTAVNNYIGFRCVKDIPK